MSADLDIDDLLSDLATGQGEDVSLDGLDACESGDERANQRARVRGTERMVPAAVRRVLPANFLFRQDVLERIVVDAKAKALVAGRATHEAGIRRIISECWDEATYRRWVCGLVKETLSRGHLERRGADRLVPGITPKLPPATSPWRAKGNLDLGLDAVLDAPADEMAVGLASMIVGTPPGGAKKTQALVVGAGSSAVGLCVDGIERELGRVESRIEVIEVDAFEWPRGSRCILGPRFRWDQDLVVAEPTRCEKARSRMDFTRLVRPRFHILIATLPCPAVGVAAQARNRYITDGTEESRTVADPGRCGLKRWTEMVGAALARGVDQLRSGGTVVGVVPLGMRATFQDAGEGYKPGLTYIPTEEPWQSVASMIEKLGLHLERTMEVIEEAPRNQPWVAIRRPKCRFFVARKESGR